MLPGRHQRMPTKPQRLVQSVCSLRWTLNGKKAGKIFQLSAEEHKKLCEQLEDMLLLGPVTPAASHT